MGTKLGWRSAGGGLMSAFPLAYAVLMPALYAPIIAMLLGLAFRGVAFEFVAMLAAIGMVSIATPFLNVQRWFAWPNIILTAPVPVALAGISILLLRSLTKKYDYQPLFPVAHVVRAVICRARNQHISLYCAAEPHDLAGGPPRRKVSCSWLHGVGVLIPLILGYTGGLIGYSTER